MASRLARSVFAALGLATTAALIIFSTAAAACDPIICVGPTNAVVTTIPKICVPPE